jgi:hypothetical protein
MTDRSTFRLAIAVTAMVVSASLLFAFDAALPPAKPTKHWSFQPIRNEQPTAARPGESTNPIDFFIDRQLKQKGLKPVAPVDKRTLLRRAYYDLIGLPPSPEASAEFLKDASPGAFAKLIDRLLASPQYGERWGRHWLDVVRYADTAGETADFPSPQAWRYRNYVIDSFNADKPYNQFLMEQVAGDILASKLPADAPGPRYAELITATGYIAIARRFGGRVDSEHSQTLDDTIDAMGKSVLGLTIACARCHDHKFDPITSNDYYALYGIFESTRYPTPGFELTPRPADLVRLVSPAEYDRQYAPVAQEIAAVDAVLKKANDELAKLKTLAMQTRVEIGHGGFENGGAQDFSSGMPAPPEALAIKPGQVIQLLILPKANYGADSTAVELKIEEVGGQNRRWTLVDDLVPDLLGGNPHADRHGNAAVWCLLDASENPSYLLESHADVDNHKGLHSLGSPQTPCVAVNTTDAPIKTTTPIYPAHGFVMHPSPKFGVAVEWISPIEGTIRVTGRVADADNSGGDGIEWRLDHFNGELGAPMLAMRQFPSVDETMKKRNEVAAKTPKVDMAYAVSEGKPHDAQFLKRGDPEQKGDPVPRRFLQVLGGQPVPADGGSGRFELAQWLSDPANPLTPRVMVNRIWQHHFGMGLVTTTNDFGTRGSPPSHPELLDYFAKRFIDSGWSIKAMHRLICNSQAYQRTSGADPHNDAVDPANKWLWKFARRRLSAEEIRDSMLLASGELDPTPGGPHPFPPEETWKFTQHAPFSEVYDTNRRSIYLITHRLKRNPILANFDSADPSSSTGERFTTTVPTQALFFMNDPFVHARAAAMVTRLKPVSDDHARLDLAFNTLFARNATAEEQAAAAKFIADYEAALIDKPPSDRTPLAWAAYYRMLLSSNEFIYVD